MSNGNLGTMKDRIAIITGASRGLGRNTAVNLAQRGVDVIFTYRFNQKEAESLIRSRSSRKKSSRISSRYRRHSLL
jgi:NAD(P)-dependent dehydrogenase (short-subunit alcohol dehydrogenase family)